jgi:hypothetical protein
LFRSQKRHAGCCFISGVHQGGIIAFFPFLTARSTTLSAQNENKSKSKSKKQYPSI